MIGIDAQEAVLFRMLVAFFGEDRVIPHMSVLAVCGGELPGAIVASLEHGIRESGHPTLGEWAKANRCLFTIVNHSDIPVMVIEFVADFRDAIDVIDLQRRQFLKPVLQAAGVPYVQIDNEEYSAMTDPGSRVTIFNVLRAKVEDIDVNCGT